MRLSVRTATEADAALIAALRGAVADRLTERHGRGHWSSRPTEAQILRGIRTSRVVTAWNRGRLVGTFRLATKRPWAIDLRYFADAHRPLYLHDMAVDPGVQGRGVGRRLLEEAEAVARAWPSDVIRLDAYDHAAGAGAFYEKCGFREVGRATYRGVPLIYFDRFL